MVSHGKNYIKAVQNINKTKKYEGTITSSSQKVFTIIPKKYDYENTDGICKQISLFNSELFFASSSFSNYAKSITGALKGLSGSNSYRIVNNIKSYKSTNVLSNYEVHSKFVKGEDISLEILSFISALQNNQKASVIFTIGGHSVSLVLNNNDGKINLAYYDAYFGQIYTQTIMQSEADQVLNANEQFVNPISILNPDNILIGRALLRDDANIVPSVSISLLSFITDTKSDNAINEIAVSEKIAPKELLKYLALVPPTLYNIKYATKLEAFNNFLDVYGADLIKEIQQVKKCVSLIKSCSNSYLDEVVSIPYKNFDENFIQKVINRKNLNVNEKHEGLPSVVKEAKPTSKVCIQEADLKREITNAEKNFFKHIFGEKEIINDLLDKCVVSAALSEKKHISREMCGKFEKANPELFSRLNNAYYDNRDLLKQRNEECFGDSKVSEILGESIDMHIDL
jgi:hypothetical protein